MDPELVRRNVAALSDDDLRSLAQAPPGRFADEVRAAMQEELARRGLTALPPPLPEVPPLSPDYRSGRRLTRTLYLLVGLQLAATALVTIGYAIQWVVIGGGGSPLGGADVAIELGIRVRQLAFVAAVVVFCFWIHRMYKNLPALGSSSRKYTPGAAVGGYFIPVVSLVRGYRVMRELWMESQPAPEQLPDGTPLRRHAPLIGWWWGLHLATNLTARLASLPTQNLDDWIRISQLSTLHFIVLSTAAVLFALVVRGVARRQAEQWDDLVRRQPVPPPADRLR